MEITMTVAYVMRAFKTTGPTGYVYWAVLGSPDYTGAESGYNPADLTSIAIEYQQNLPINGSGGVVAPGLAGGDLSGTFPNPNVIKIQGESVSTAVPTSGQSLQYNGINWAPANSSSVVSGATVSGDLFGTLPSPSVVKIQGLPVSSTVSTFDGYALITSGGVYTQIGVENVLNVKTFGAKGDGSTNDYAAITAALNVAAQNGKPTVVFFPAGIYNVSQHIQVPSYVYLKGAGQYIAGASSGTMIQLTATDTCLLLLETVYAQFEDMRFDGGGFPTIAVVDIEPYTNSVRFRRCTISGAIPGGVSGTDLIKFGGLVADDTCAFYECNIIQHPEQFGVQYCHRCVYNVNSNAFLIDFHKCMVRGAYIMVEFSGGSCNFYNCQGYEIQSCFFQVDTSCQAFEVNDFYTEQSAAVFFNQLFTSGANGYETITFRHVIANDTCNFACTGLQPVVIESCVTGGNFQYNPVPTYGIYPPLFINNVTNTGHGLIGTGAYQAYRFMDLEGVNTLGYTGGTLTTRLTAVADRFIIDGYEHAIGVYPYDSNNIISILMGDTHLVNSTLTANRIYTLSNTGAINGNVIRFSRAGALDGYSLTIDGVSGNNYTIAAPGDGYVSCEFRFDDLAGWLMWSKSLG